MLKPIGVKIQQGFRADKDDINPITGEYNDPLMKMPLRGAAFSNEVGEGLRPLIGSYETLTWIPALLYIGADIYDKYKNDQTEYSPDSKRGLKQAVFQGMASIIFPLVAVKAGQNLISLLGLKSSDKITINMQEHISNLACSFVANGKMHKYKGRDEECVKDFLETVSDNIDFRFGNRLHFSKQENIEKYSEKTVRDLIEMYKDLHESSEAFINSKWYTNYQQARVKGQTKNVAVKSVLSKYQQNKNLKGKIIKTIGGFITLAMAIKPIDTFVENVLLDKIFK